MFALRVYIWLKPLLPNLSKLETNLNEMEEFLDAYELPKLNINQVNNLNNNMNQQEKVSQIKKSQNQIDLLQNCMTFKEHQYNAYCSLRWKRKECFQTPYEASIIQIPNTR